MLSFEIREFVKQHDVIRIPSSLAGQSPRTYLRERGWLKTLTQGLLVHMRGFSRGCHLPPDGRALGGPVRVFQLFVPVFGMLPRGRGMVHEAKFAVRGGYNVKVSRCGQWTNRSLRFLWGLSLPLPVAASHPLAVFVEIKLGRVHACAVAAPSSFLGFAFLGPPGLFGVGFAQSDVSKE